MTNSTNEHPIIVTEQDAIELRRAAYTNEADQLYFKAQRGECLTQLWLDKVDEIRLRYPSPVTEPPPA